jgi:hypothetical protein
MAKITVGGVEHDIPPFKLREIRAAAPYIDRVLAQRRNLSAVPGETPEQTAERILEETPGAMEEMTGTMADTIAVVAVGIIKGRREYPYTVTKINAVVDEIEGEMSMDEVGSLSTVFNDILREAGMIRTRPTMPGEGTSTSPSAIASTGSSQSSSLPDAPAETGTE